MRQRTQKGSALIEMALLFPFITTLLVGVAEVGNAINAYITVSEASRDGARLALRQNSSTGVDTLVQTLTQRLPSSTLQTTTHFGTDVRGNKLVTVEVRYGYRLMLTNLPLANKLLKAPLTFQVSTTMPIP